MINHRRVSHLAIFFICLIRISAFRCPKDQECSCADYNGIFEIECPKQNNSFFRVNIQPRYIKIECSYKSPKWSDFHLNVTSLERNNVETIRFATCDLPPSNTSFSDITRMLQVNGTEKLIFESFKNLSSERLSKHHLDGFEDLKYLMLPSNNLSYLDEDLLDNLPNLRGLDLRANNLRLSTRFFNYTSELLWLELGDNNLQSIPLGIFDNMKNLVLLNIWKNHFIELPSGIFDKLVALKALGLNMNNMIDLPEDIFAKLENLETINLSSNKFTSLPKDLLRNNTKLRTVKIMNNRNMTTLPEGFFGNLTELKMLDLKWNGLVTLPEDLFWGSFSLTNITLGRNRLKSLPAHIFRDSKQLTKLELNLNEIEELPDYVFINTNHLEKLDLSRNRITAISEYSLYGLYALKELNMENNHLKIISSQSFNSLDQLKIIKLSNNNLTLNSDLSKYRNEFGTNSPFYNCISLEELSLANNNISEIFSDWNFSTKLRKLDLKYNNISSIAAADLQFISGKTTVDLTHNKIQHIFLHDAEEIARIQTNTQDVTILMGNNPVICDCNIYDLLRYIEGKMHHKVKNYFQIIPGNLTCRSPAWLENKAIRDLKSESLTCKAQDVISNVTCPEKCSCLFRPADKSFIVDCSRGNLTRVPNNMIKVGGSFQFELDFSGNMLVQMPNLKELGYNSVKKLDLSQNNISEIFLEGLSTTIQILRLHNNNISRIRPNVLEFLKNSSNLAQLTLRENPWECDCDAMDLLNFIQTKYKNISDLSRVTCRGNHFISQMTLNDFCPPTDKGLIIGISVTLPIIGLLLSVFALYYIYQKHIKIWLFAHQWCLWFVTEEELDKEKLYDAFVSYSQKDHDFVVNELVSKLESGSRSFKLCLHYRDWLAGEWIPTQIARSVEESRRTIVVLSPNFLESVWGRMEFRAAHSQALSDGRARVILILYGDIGPTDNLDEELRAYISMNTYVKWDDPWFWDKLRYALPHLSKSVTKDTAEAGRKIFENHQLCIKMDRDKKELIFPVEVLQETMTNTTPPADTLKTFISDEEQDKDLPQSKLIETSCKLNHDISVVSKSERLNKQDSLIDTQSTTA